MPETAMEMSFGASMAIARRCECLSSQTGNYPGKAEKQDCGNGHK